MKRFFVIFSVIILVLLCIFYFFSLRGKSNFNGYLRHDGEIQIGDKKIYVQVAESPKDKARGLSGKKALSDNEGMLFLFPTKTYPGFWMKDMNFAIDIIWISENSIIHIDKNIPPPEIGQKDSELKIYRPPKTIDHVLEVNSGFCTKENIKAGDTVKIII